MSSSSTIHPYLDWAKERLDEIDATLASFEHKAAKLQADARTKAETAMTDMRTARDQFHKSIRSPPRSMSKRAKPQSPARRRRWRLNGLLSRRPCRPFSRRPASTSRR